MTALVLPLVDMLRMALTGLPTGWTFLPATAEVTAATPCLLLSEDDLSDAPTQGFPREALEAGVVEDTARWTRNFEDPPSDALLVESFVYYLVNDAPLPAPNAPEPAPWAEVERRIDREFYDSLGAERPGTTCRRPQCSRGTVELSVLCRPHHFESIKGRPSPFSD
jgi:hypothetical protein